MREWPPYTPKRTQGALPLDPGIARLKLEELRCLSNRVPAVFLVLNDLTYFYLRCRFACDSLALRNFRLLRIVSILLLPAEAVLLRSPRYAYYR